MENLPLLIDEEEEFDDMGSYNHSLVQGNLAYLLRSSGTYSAFIELSLDASALDPHEFPTIKNELIPDVCIYPKRTVIDYDILRMKEMPPLAIEVISPRQGTFGILAKFRAYFALGVQSCWLVDPINRTVRVFSTNDESETFAEGQVRDSVLDLSIPLKEIFS